MQIEEQQITKKTKWRKGNWVDKMANSRRYGSAVTSFQTGFNRWLIVCTVSIIWRSRFLHLEHLVSISLRNSLISTRSNFNKKTLRRISIISASTRQNLIILYIYMRSLWLMKSTSTSISHHIMQIEEQQITKKTKWRKGNWVDKMANSRRYGSAVTSFQTGFNRWLIVCTVSIIWRSRFLHLEHLVSISLRNSLISTRSNFNKKTLRRISIISASTRQNLLILYI